MRGRQRAFAGSINVTGGGGSVPTVGNVQFGPDFGESAGNDGITHTITASTSLTALAFRNEQSVATVHTMPAIALRNDTQVCTVSQTGTVLGAPFWQNVETAANSAAATSIVANKPVGTALNDLLVAFVGQQSTGVATFTPPAGWTSIEKSNVGAVVKTAECFYKLATASEPSTYTFTSDQNNGPFTLEINRFIGANTTTPINVSAVTTLSATALDPDPDTPSVTTTAANCLVMSWIYHDHLALSQSHTPPAGHLETSDFQSTVVGSINGSNNAYRVFSASGATGTAGHNCTESVATDAIMMRVAIAPGPVVIA